MPSEKAEFLLALHALLIGHAHGANARQRTLTAVEEGLLLNRDRRHLRPLRHEPASGPAKPCCLTQLAARARRG